MWVKTRAMATPPYHSLGGRLGNEALGTWHLIWVHRQASAGVQLQSHASLRSQQAGRGIDQSAVVQLSCQGFVNGLLQQPPQEDAGCCGIGLLRCTNDCCGVVDLEVPSNLRAWHSVGRYQLA